jgi:hypothetical protein
MSPLPLTLARGPYDRTSALAGGRVTAAAVGLRYLTPARRRSSWMVTRGESDVTEMPMATCHVIRDRADRDPRGRPSSGWPQGSVSVASAAQLGHRGGCCLLVRLVPPGAALRRAGQLSHDHPIVHLF